MHSHYTSTYATGVGLVTEAIRKEKLLGLLLQALDPQAALL